MCGALKKLSISGYKSIRDLRKFEIKKLNVIIGANGAGKSNFIDFFRLLHALLKQNLQSFVFNSGGADGLFFNGPKATKQIQATLELDMDRYQFSLAPGAANELHIEYEIGKYLRGRTSKFISKDARESNLNEVYLRAKNYERSGTSFFRIYTSMMEWRAYHFNDTDFLAGMRREVSMFHSSILEADARNIAAFLLSLKSNSPENYIRVIETIRLAAPFFDDFFLDPIKKGPETQIRLQWKQKGSDFPFQPWHFSDGTLRFICLVTALLQPKPPSMIIIDEPELGLHPFALGILASLIQEAAQQTQIILATQSPELVNFFEPEDIIIADRDQGQSTFKRLEEKKLKDWLSDYSLGELWQKNIFEGGPSYE